MLFKSKTKSVYDRKMYEEELEHLDELIFYAVRKFGGQARISDILPSVLLLNVRKSCLTPLFFASTKTLFNHH